MSRNPPVPQKPTARDNNYRLKALRKHPVWTDEPARSPPIWVPPRSREVSLFNNLLLVDRAALLDRPRQPDQNGVRPEQRRGRSRALSGRAAGLSGGGPAVPDLL